MHGEGSSNSYHKKIQRSAQGRRQLTEIRGGKAENRGGGGGAKFWR